MRLLVLAHFTLLTTTVLSQVPYQHFEARHVHPVALTPDGNKLLAVNSPAARLSVFDATTMSLVAEIPVGLEPVTVRARTNDEAWVVNEVSDTVTVISLTSHSVIATLRVGDEPGDVVFTSGKAFVSCSRAGTIRVFDAATRADLGTITLTGDYPRALCVSHDGSKVYAAFLFSGNNTTILPRTQAPPQPPPSNPSLPPPPQTALIVPSQDSRITYDVLDHDVAEIDVASQTVTHYHSDLGTHLFALAMRPGTPELWVTNTESHNLIATEPALNGVFATNRLSRLTLGSGIDTFDLSAHAQPSGIVFEAAGGSAWICAFGSDRIARVNTSTGAVETSVDIRTGDPDSKFMRGPRGLALNEADGKLFVLNKLANTISVIDTATASVMAEVETGTHDPMPLEVKQGRGYLFDARLSGNGTVSCATCHLDADRDGLAWDLGNPAGSMVTTMGANEVIHDSRPRSRHSHPMKGPMVTQTLRDIGDGAPFHWRGDKPTIQSFNSTFENLMGGELQTAEDMDLLAAYIKSLTNHPNPNRNLDRTLPSTFGGGNPIRGRDLFNQHVNHCSLCHTLPRGSNNVLDLPHEAGRNQPIKNPSLRHVYQKQLFNPTPGGTSVSGFGMLMDGTGFQMPTVHPYVLDDLTTTADFADMKAFMLCFDTGVGKAVGHSVTVDSSNRTQAAVLADIALLEARDVAGDCDLIVRGKLAGVERDLLFASSAYKLDKAADGTLNRTALLNALSAGDSLTFLGVLPGLGGILSIDQDGDGALDGDEVSGSPVILQHPKDAISTPGGSVTFSVIVKGSGLTYAWRRNGSSFGAPNAASISVTASASGSYDVTVSNAQGSANSRVAALTVRSAPVITQQPTSKVVTPGTVGTIGVTASGAPLTYQWYKNGEVLIGATAATLVFNNAQNADTGTYTVRISNGAGSVMSLPATLDVPVPPVVHPLNLNDARVGENYSKQVTASNNPTRFSITGLPPGLSASTAGLITGRPTKSGPATVRVVASNAAGNSLAVEDEMEVFDLAAGTVGSYTGWIARHQGFNGGLGGSISVKVLANGTFTGTVQLGTTRHPISGSLQPSGITVDSTGSASITRLGQGLTVGFTVRPASKSLDGSVTDGSIHAHFSARQPGVFTTGLHTFAMLVKPAQRGDDSVPQGYSIGRYTVSSKGSASGTITLADGTKSTFSGPVEEGGLVSVFKLLYANSGSVLGSLGISPGISWYKKPQSSTSKTKSYKAGFPVLDLDVVCAPYSPPVGIVMGLQPGPGNARMSFFGGGAPSPATRLDLTTIELGTGSKVVAKIMAPNPGVVSLTVTPLNGGFDGSFLLLDADTTVVPNKPVTRIGRFTGVIVGNKGYAFYQLPELPPGIRVLSGSATLEGN